ncbi:HD domain-containing protein [bacterium]|nr:HD domain-containing protein [bacterium]
MEEYRELFENTKIAMIIVTDDTISLVNRAFEELVGYSRKEIEYKKSLREFIATEEEIKRLEYYKELRSKNPSLAPDRYTVDLKDRNGNIKHVLVFLNMIPETEKCLVSLVDVTDIMEATKETQRLLKVLHGINRNIIEAKDEAELLKGTVTILKNIGEYKDVSIETDSHKNYTYSAKLTEENENLGSLNVLKEEGIDELEKEIIEDLAKELGYLILSLRTRNELVLTEEKYKNIFENAPIALLEEDISKVLEHIERQEGSDSVGDIKSYLLTHLDECIELVEFSDINKAGLNLYNATNRREVEDKLTSLMRDILKEELTGIANGLSEGELRTRLLTLSGREKFVYLRWFLLSLKNRPSKILTAIIDITQEEVLKEALRKKIEEIKESLIQTIEVLSSIVEIKDPYTFEHQKKVSLISCAIAKQLGLSQEIVEQIQIAGLLHDIGKIGIPAEVLNKPGKLSQLEFEIIKLHPEVGYRLLKKIKPLEHVADIVLQHHERLNGSGYPRGIKGDSIVLPARIIAVADVLEAMSSHRPYRPAYPIEKVLEELINGRDELYDPEVVDACVDLINREKLESLFEPLFPLWGTYR